MQRGVSYHILRLETLPSISRTKCLSSFLITYVPIQMGRVRSGFLTMEFAVFGYTRATDESPNRMVGKVSAPCMLWQKSAKKRSRAKENFLVGCGSMDSDVFNARYDTVKLFMSS